MHQFAGYVLREHAFDDAVSVIWHASVARPGSAMRAAGPLPDDLAAEPARAVTVRVFDLPEGGQFAGPLFAFREDAQAAARLTHAHVLATHEVGRHDLNTYVVSRHTAAVPLSAHLRRPLTPAQAVELLAPLADVLDAAARGGLAHGAVHPRSIWVEPDPMRSAASRALLSGFGLHHVLRVLAARRRKSDVVEDFLYMAPELVRGGRPTNRSDQYALAAALLHATTGTPPFGGGQLAALQRAQRFGRPPSVGQDIEGVAGLDQIVARALAKDPDNRFDSCAQFLALVAAWVRDHERVTPPRAAAEPLRTGPTPMAPAAPEPPWAGPAASRPAAAEPSQAAPTPSPPTTDAAGATAPASPDEPTPDRGMRRRPVRRRPNPSSVMRGAPALAAAGVIIGIVAALVLMASLSSSAPPTSELVAAATTPAAGGAPGLRWRQALDEPAIGVHVLSAGVAAVTPQHVVVLDPRTGRVRATLDGEHASSAVTAGGGLVTVGTDGMQVRDLVDNTIQWVRDTSDAGPPEVVGETIYHVSGRSVPRLVALAAASGERLWRFPEDDPAFSADAVVAPGEHLVYVADRHSVHGILPEGASIETDTTAIEAGERADRPVDVWRTGTDEPLWPMSVEAVAGGVVTADRSGDVCLRRDADGETVWCVRVRGVAGTEPVVLADDDGVYVAAGGSLTALDAGTGRRRWMRAGTWRDAVLAGDGRLVAVAGSGEVSVLAAGTGNIRTLEVVRVPSEATLAVAGNALYAAGDDGEVVSIGLPDAGGSRTRAVGGDP